MDNISCLVRYKGKFVCGNCGSCMENPNNCDKIAGSERDKGDHISYLIRCKNCGSVIKVNVPARRRFT